MAMLKEASRLKLITYAGIQERTENFSYGVFDALNKPPPIQVKNLHNNCINGTAAQKYCLFRLFPLIFADITVRLKTFKIYLVLREILDMVLAVPTRKSWLPYVETLAINFQKKQIDGDTLFYMNDFDLLKPFTLSYKNQILFLKEREKLFLTKTTRENLTSSSPQHQVTATVVDDSVQKTSEHNDAVQLSTDVTAIIPPITTNCSTSVKLLPDPYVLPDLPNQVKNAINHKEMEKFDKLCNFRSIVIDAIFYDLKRNYNLIYPTKTQYTTVISGLLNHLGVERDTKKMVSELDQYSLHGYEYSLLQNSWRESLISKFKRERQNLITMVSCSSGNTNQMEKIAEAAKIDFENNLYDEEELNHLWIQTYAYRQEFVRNSTTQDIINQFPAYSNPYRTPATPLPTIQVEDDHLNVYLDWTFICSSKSIEESIAVLVGLYSLMDLKFNTYRTTARFLYVYLMNDQQKQPNNISKIFKEYNIELQYKSTSSLQLQHEPSSSVQLQRQSPSFVEKIKEINNNNDIFPDDLPDSVHDLIIDVEENEAEGINAEIPTSKTILMKSTSKPSQKRKSADLPQNTDLGEEENIPPRKKTTNSKRSKRH
ncbi:unnamed protein product [Rotaria sp. Silwood1]|nr:unnamed protein product [Rotaria sp. Silwood1]CAF4966407.1 unnamed protein product [Rotaria sp. Silwood1]